MKRFFRILSAVAVTILLAALCVPAYYGALALAVPSVREEIRNYWALSAEGITGYEVGVFDQIDRYRPADCLVTRGADVYSIPLPAGATPFENRRHPRREHRAQYLVRGAPFLAWREDLTGRAPDGFSCRMIGSMLYLASAAGDVCAFITGSDYGRTYKLLEISAWGRPEDGSGAPELIALHS